MSEPVTTEEMRGIMTASAIMYGIKPEITRNIQTQNSSTYSIKDGDFVMDLDFSDKRVPDVVTNVQLDKFFKHLKTKYFAPIDLEASPVQNFRDIIEQCSDRLREDSGYRKQLKADTEDLKTVTDDLNILNGEASAHSIANISLADILNGIVPGDEKTLHDRIEKYGLVPIIANFPFFVEPSNAWHKHPYSEKVDLDYQKKVNRATMAVLLSDNMKLMLLRNKNFDNLLTLCYAKGTNENARYIPYHYRDYKPDLLKNVLDYKFNSNHNSIVSKNMTDEQKMLATIMSAYVIGKLPEQIKKQKSSHSPELLMQYPHVNRLLQTMALVEGGELKDLNFGLAQNIIVSAFLGASVIDGMKTKVDFADDMVDELSSRPSDTKLKDFGNEILQDFDTIYEKVAKSPMKTIAILQEILHFVRVNKDVILNPDMLNKNPDDDLGIGDDNYDDDFDLGD